MGTKVDCFQLRGEGSRLALATPSRKPSTRLPSWRDCCRSALTQGAVSGGNPVTEARGSRSWGLAEGPASASALTPTSWGCRVVGCIPLGFVFPLNGSPLGIGSLGSLLHWFWIGTSCPWRGKESRVGFSSPSYLPRQGWDRGRHRLLVPEEVRSLAEQT